MVWRVGTVVNHETLQLIGPMYDLDACYEMRDTRRKRKGERTMSPRITPLTAPIRNMCLNHK